MCVCVRARACVYFGCLCMQVFVKIAISDGHGEMSEKQLRLGVE